MEPTRRAADLPDGNPAENCAGGEKNEFQKLPEHQYYIRRRMAGVAPIIDQKDPVNTIKKQTYDESKTTRSCGGHAREMRFRLRKRRDGWNCANRARPPSLRRVPLPLGTGIGFAGRTDVLNIVLLDPPFAVRLHGANNCFCRCLLAVKRLEDFLFKARQRV